MASNKSWLILPAIYLSALAIAGFIGFVKFMAWWHIAFGDCKP